MNQPQKIARGVFLVGSEDLSGAGDCMIYAIQGGPSTYCLIDAGTAHKKEILANINQTPLASLTLSHLILTHAHYDHIGAAHLFKSEFPNIKIAAHDWDKAAIEGKPNTEQITAASWYGADLSPVNVDITFREAEESLILEEITLKILHTPGHTPGSISVLYEHPEAGKILFGQDIHGPFMEEFNSNITDWRRSMKELLALEPEILCEGHYGVIKGRDRVKQFIKRYLQQYR